ncbi:hypothetical protein DVH24_009277 [Malus domestica]|uniref:Uncharacterized protein n=1 Tax=Malus domestica TaxID=3750 RepID=A0A498KPS0_MALDO|nr:hypothetical protein DVH24_009277 [Malus domestica]
MRWMSTDKRVKPSSSQLILIVMMTLIMRLSQESEDGPGDAEEGGYGDGVETQSDIVRGSALDEDDS